MNQDPTTSSTFQSRLAVCSWSLQPKTPEELAEKMEATGISRVQLELDHLVKNPAVWGQTEQVLQAAGIEIVSGMFGCMGEDYTTLDTIRETGGIAPDSTWEENLKNIKATAPLAVKLGLKFVSFHAGFVPHSAEDPDFAKMVSRLKEIAQIFAAVGIEVGLETGQETAEALSILLNELNEPNLGVNFDPANMLLYGKGDPIEALRLLQPWIRQVHIKDATQTKTPGTWGEEVAVGSGEVNWTAFFATLKAANYTGNYIIEREAGTQRVEDIRIAKQVVSQIN